MASANQKAPYAAHFDVIIVGAGISGINTAYRIQEAGIVSSYAILESRSAVGGTWDLFRYPGIRSDSDMSSFGFAWKAWPTDQILAPGAGIKEYISTAAAEYGIDKHIRYHQKVTSAEWQTGSGTWTLQVQDGLSGQQNTYTARFVVLGTGYYDYEQPLDAAIPGIEDFSGTVIHPQFWPEGFDCANEDVVIIGSGATAITLLPSLAGKAKHVTMLQRSPSYIFSVPLENRLGKFLRYLLPQSFVARLCRLLNISVGYLFYLFCMKYPQRARAVLRKATIKQLPPEVQWDPHFKPSYNPWEQRLCVAPKGDFFAALRSGKASVVTEKIERVTEKAIHLESGQCLHPSIIITATGLKVKFAGGIKLSVDGRPLDASQKFAWKAAMVQDVPNCFFMMGYANSSWTLGADAASQLMVRLLRLMKERGVSQAVPRLADPESMEKKPIINLSSTYLQTAPQMFPHSGSGQWSTRSNYFRDIYQARRGDILTGLELR